MGKEAWEHATFIDQTWVEYGQGSHRTEGQVGGGAHGLSRKEGTNHRGCKTLMECWVMAMEVSGFWSHCEARLGCGWWFGSGEGRLRFLRFLVEGRGKGKS